MKKHIQQKLSLLKHRKARLFVLLWIVLFNIGLWFVSAFLTFLIEPSRFESYFDALLKAGITWMIEPGFYDPDALLSIRIIGILTVIIAMVSFSGGIIAYVADGLSSFIEKAETGKGKLVVFDHLLILNWNVKVLELIADHAMDDHEQTIVVVVKENREQIKAAIDSKLYEIPKKEKLQNNPIVVFEGNIFSKQMLDQVCMQEAKTIVIFADENQSESQADYVEDITVIKTLMLLNNLTTNPKQAIIVEVKQRETKKLIEDTFQESKLDGFPRVIPLMSDELMGKLIAQTLFYPSLHHVYNELMSSKGVEFYSIPKQDTLAYLESHNHAIPIVTTQNRTFVVCEHQDDAAKKRLHPRTSPATFQIKKVCNQSQQTIVIVGRNKKLDYILESIQAFEFDGDTKSHVVLMDFKSIQTMKDQLSELSHIDTILLLSDETSASDTLDTDVLIALLFLQEISKKHQAKIILELLDPRHYDIAMSYQVDHTIISNRYVSHMISQISKNRELARLYDELLRYDGQDSTSQTKEVYVYPAKNILDALFPLAFPAISDFVYQLSFLTSGEKVPIGLIHQKQLHLFHGNLDSQSLQIEAEDEIVVIEE